MGFYDFAGSTLVHSVGGWAGLMGALVLGPRLGKYGPGGKSKAIRTLITAENTEKTRGRGSWQNNYLMR